jgi:hypothetical protein
MKNSRSVASFLVSVATSLLALANSGAAQAQDIHWSVGLSSPGVQVGVSSAIPVVVHPAHHPLYRQPPPVYVAPRPMVYVRPVPVFVPPPHFIRADWRYPGHRHGWQYQRHEMERGGHDGRG